MIGTASGPNGRVLRWRLNLSGVKEFAPCAKPSSPARKGESGGAALSFGINFVLRFE